MATIVKGEPRRLTLRQQRGRAVNAVAEVLRKKLLVPNIYLGPHFPSLAVDVLAVDRAGSGDLHGVEIRLGNVLARERGKNAANTSALAQQMQGQRLHLKRKIKEIRKQIMSLPTHYKYLAVPQSGCDLVLKEMRPLLYSPDGIGRIGIISITDQGEGPPGAEIVVTPERFRVDGAQLSKIEKNLINNKKVRPDIEVRI
jgi:hypothetical protein